MRQSSITAPLDAEAARVGRRVREIRTARGMTLVELARRADLSHPFLSQLERGLARLSMPSLDRLARALGLSQVELLSEGGALADVSPNPVVRRAGQGRAGAYGLASGRVLLEGGAFTPMEVRGTDLDFGEIWRHPEQEWLYLVDGEAEVEIGGRRSRLRAGDSVVCPSQCDHRWRAVDPAGYLMLVVKERMVGR